MFPEKERMLRRSVCFFIAATLFLLATATGAYAGFQWVPSAPQATPPVYVPPAIDSGAALSTGSVGPAINTLEAPLVINPNPLQGMSAPVQSIVSNPVAVEVQPQSAPAVPSNEVFAEIAGFGSDMPLALALRQIVPPEYGFSFGDGVNPGYRVSWNGGRPWNEVVSEMLAPLNLSAEVLGKVVVIESNADDLSIGPLPQEQEPAAGSIEMLETETPETSQQPGRSNITDPGEKPSVIQILPAKSDS